MDKNDEQFIDNVNKELNECDKINKKEAMEANKYFKQDFQDIQNKYKEIYNKLHNETLDEVFVELFENDKVLIDRNLEELQYHVYKNEWFDEFPINDFYNKDKLLQFFQIKLETEADNRIREKIKEIRKK